jgi:hypothetical protein
MVIPEVGNLTDLFYSASLAAGAVTRAFGFGSHWTATSLRADYRGNFWLRSKHLNI